MQFLELFSTEKVHVLTMFIVTRIDIKWEDIQ